MNIHSLKVLPWCSFGQELIGALQTPYLHEILQFLINREPLFSNPNKIMAIFIEHLVPFSCCNCQNQYQIPTITPPGALSNHLFTRETLQFPRPPLQRGLGLNYSLFVKKNTTTKIKSSTPKWCLLVYLI